MSVQPFWLFCSFLSSLIVGILARSPYLLRPMKISQTYYCFAARSIPNSVLRFLFLEGDFHQPESGSKPSLAPHGLSNYICSPQLRSGISLSRTLFPTVPLTNWTPRGSWLQPLFPVCPLSPSAVLWFPPAGMLPVGPPSCRVQPELI